MDARAELQEKLKFYAALEKKVRRLLLKGENEEAVKVLVQIIKGYKSIGVIEKAKIFEDELKNFASSINLNLEKFLEPSENPEDSEKIMGFIESLEKKVKRRILQGKTQDAINDLKYIISELRNLQHLEKAELLESIMNQFIADLSAMSSGTKPGAPPMIVKSVSTAYTAPSNARPFAEPSEIQSSNPPVIAQPKGASSKPFVSPTVPPMSSSEEHLPHISELLPGFKKTNQPQKPPMVTVTPAKPPKIPMAPPAQPPLPIAVPIASPRSPIAPPRGPQPLQEQPQDLEPADSKSSSTIKDQPYSEEELLLKKLFEIKDMLGKK